MVKKIGVVIFNDEYFSHEGLAALKWASNLDAEAQLGFILLVREVVEQSQPADGKSDAKKGNTSVKSKEKGDTQSDAKEENTLVKNKEKVDGKLDDTGSNGDVQSVVAMPQSEQIETTDYKVDELLDSVRELAKNNESKKAWIDTFERYVDVFRAQKKLVKSYRGSNIHKILEESIKVLQLDTLVLGQEAIGLTRTRNIEVQLKSQCSVILASIDDPKPMNTTIEISGAEPAVRGCPEQDQP
ncbi:uncharacterized protein LOC110432358 isoform X2 [Sorghum bicolor]|uniref:uncharacterized protein LOC110432358 isoform X2 n=1 Tax=Sorghum bicolor TaxID=4558 RepID=UPI000B42618B|nr:uncharacterized protein LOC110432358 isoform X2 [Sorghum bicolor]|eukprot:XP_021308261.1 uncharacterized protein LOC110432358 isoform X2 [Sorghum bicolor]